MIFWNLSVIISYVDGRWSSAEVRKDENGYVTVGPDVSALPEVVSALGALGLSVKSPVFDSSISDVTLRFSASYLNNRLFVLSGTESPSSVVGDRDVIVSVLSGDGDFDGYFSGGDDGGQLYAQSFDWHSPLAVAGFVDGELKIGEVVYAYEPYSRIGRAQLAVAWGKIYRAINKRPFGNDLIVIEEVNEELGTTVEIAAVAGDTVQGFTYDPVNDFLIVFERNNAAVYAVYQDGSTMSLGSYSEQSINGLTYVDGVGLVAAVATGNELLLIQGIEGIYSSVVTEGWPKTITADSTIQGFNGIVFEGSGEGGLTVIAIARWDGSSNVNRRLVRIILSSGVASVLVEGQLGYVNSILFDNDVIRFHTGDMSVPAFASNSYYKARLETVDLELAVVDVQLILTNSVRYDTTTAYDYDAGLYYVLRLNPSDGLKQLLTWDPIAEEHAELTGFVNTDLSISVGLAYAGSYGLLGYDGQDIVTVRAVGGDIVLAPIVPGVSINAFTYAGDGILGVFLNDSAIRYDLASGSSVVVNASLGFVVLSACTVDGVVYVSYQDLNDSQFKVGSFDLLTGVLTVISFWSDAFYLRSGPVFGDLTTTGFASSIFGGADGSYWFSAEGQTILVIDDLVLPRDPVEFPLRAQYSVGLNWVDATISDINFDPDSRQYNFSISDPVDSSSAIRYQYVDGPVDLWSYADYD